MILKSRPSAREGAILAATAQDESHSERTSPMLVTRFGMSTAEMPVPWKADCAQPAHAPLVHK